VTELAPDDGMWHLEITYAPPISDPDWLPVRKLSISMREDTITGDMYLTDVSGEFANDFSTYAMREVLVQNLADAVRIAHAGRR